MTESDDEMDKRAARILQVVRQCWLALSDLQTGDKMVALAKLDDMALMEVVGQDPAYAPDKRH